MSQIAIVDFFSTRATNKYVFKKKNNEIEWASKKESRWNKEQYQRKWIEIYDSGTAISTQTSIYVSTAIKNKNNKKKIGWYQIKLPDLYTCNICKCTVYIKTESDSVVLVFSQASWMKDTSHAENDIDNTCIYK